MRHRRPWMRTKETELSSVVRRTSTVLGQVLGIVKSRYSQGQENGDFEDNDRHAMDLEYLRNN
jgi:hypothetical protein